MKLFLVIHRFPAIALPTRRRVALPMFFACLLLVAGPAARGQITNVDDTTSTPIEGAGHDYIKAMNETVNPASAKPELQHPGATVLKSTRPPGSGDLRQH
jgi:hypothetical protein